jgi:endonuclease V-like protein UPF0215 family
MKREIKIIGIDDAPFSFNQKKVVVIGVVMRGNGYIEGILKDEIEVDGVDATTSITTLVNGTRHKNQIKVIMLDGISLGGFNVIDVHKIYKDTGLPVITITREKPNFIKIKNALQKHFTDWEKRWDTILKGNIRKLNGEYPIYVQYVGISFPTVREIISLCTIRGAIPEPIRIAHLIATGITLGESRGRA